MVNADFELHNFTNSLDTTSLGSTLVNLSDSFSEFLVSFSKSDDNFLKVPIVDNQLFRLGGANADEINFDANFFNTGNAQVGNESLKKITWEKITQNRFLKSKNDINNLYNCNLDDNKYEKL